MPYYTLHFRGQRIGSLGLSHTVSIGVEAPNPDSARWKAYDTHEHISGGVDGVIVMHDDCDNRGGACNACRENKL